MLHNGRMAPAGYETVGPGKRIQVYCVYVYICVCVCVLVIDCVWESLQLK